MLKKITNHGDQIIIKTTEDIDFENRTITITGEINDKMAECINSALRSLARDSDDDIIIYIQSPGGSVSAGFSIYDTTKSLHCDIVTVCCGMTASMGAFLFTACGTKGKRYIQPNAEILIHQPLGSMQGQATDIKIHAEHIIKTKFKLNTIISEVTGQNIEKVNQDTDRDYIVSADDALRYGKYGLADIKGDPFYYEINRT